MPLRRGLVLVIVGQGMRTGPEVGIVPLTGTDSRFDRLSKPAVRIDIAPTHHDIPSLATLGHRSREIDFRPLENCP
jgi:hypothetical protein